MNPSVKKAINIISYTLNVILVLVLLGVFKSKDAGPTKKEIDFEAIKQGIIEREQADIPLKIQQFDKVYGITINDMVFTSKVEPYTGYLITTWDIDEKQDLTVNQWAANGYKDKYVRKQKEVFVELGNITPSPNGEISWQNNWTAAYYSVKDN